MSDSIETMTPDDFDEAEDLLDELAKWSVKNIDSSAGALFYAFSWSLFHMGKAMNMPAEDIVWEVAAIIRECQDARDQKEKEKR